MRPLRITVPLGAGETPFSFASRLAAANRLAARELCRDFEASFQSVVDGDAVAIATIALLGSVEPSALMAHAFIRQTGLVYEYLGEKLPRYALRRISIHACPACLTDDIRGNPKLAPASAVHGRAIWLIDAIKTCPVHDLGLVEIGRAAPLHDFAHHVQPAISGVNRLIEEATRRAPTGFENYVLDRLDGARPSPFLDGLELHAAIGTCETIGAVEIFGRNVSRERLTSEDWRLAGARGFEIAAGGAVAIGGFLDRLQSTYPPCRHGKLGPQALFGRLHQMLERAGQAYDPLSAVVREHVIRTHPVGPGDIILGQPVTAERNLHSIRTLSNKIGMHPKRLRKTLLASGIIDDSQMALPDHGVIFDAGRASDALRKAKDALVLHAAGRYINAPRVQIELLARNRFIQPFMPARAFLAQNRYALEDLDGFMTRLLAGAESVRKPGPSMADIPMASRRAMCSGVQVIRFILDGKLTWIGQAAGRRGYLSVLVDVEEVRSKLCRPALPGLTKRQVEQRLRTNTYVVNALIQHRHLKSFTVKHPINQRLQVVVKDEEIARFERKYVSLFMLAQEHGKHSLAVLKKLEEKGIEPALKPVETIGARFYWRRDC